MYATAICTGYGSEDQRWFVTIVGKSDTFHRIVIRDLNRGGFDDGPSTLAYAMAAAESRDDKPSVFVALDNIDAMMNPTPTHNYTLGYDDALTEAVTDAVSVRTANITEPFVVSEGTSRHVDLIGAFAEVLMDNVAAFLGDNGLPREEYDMCQRLIGEAYTIVGILRSSPGSTPTSGALASESQEILDSLCEKLEALAPEGMYFGHTERDGGQCWGFFWLQEERPYTVILLYPDYMADPYGQDTWMGHVMARSSEEAIGRARAVVFDGSMDEDGESIIQYHADLHCIACIEGQHEDLK